MELKGLVELLATTRLENGLLADIAVLLVPEDVRGVEDWVELLSREVLCEFIKLSSNLPGELGDDDSGWLRFEKSL